MSRWFILSLFLGFVLPSKSLFCQDCAQTPDVQSTNDYFFSASSAQGAVGDVVAVDLALTVENIRPELAGFSLIACYDANLAELIEPPLYSDYYGELVYLSNFVHAGGSVGPQRPGGGRAALVFGNISSEGSKTVLFSGQSFPMLTFFFRLKGQAGDSFQLRFCDGEFMGRDGDCIMNELILIYGSEREEGRTASLLSSRHVPGTVHILPGEATHPDPPVLPPDARAYLEPPTAETAQIHFELTGGVAAPGDTEVPLELYITSNFEFSGFSVSLLFPWPALSRYLEVTRVEEQTRPGIVRVDDAGGGGHGLVGMVMANSRRRVGQEGERVHIATIYVNVREEARETVEITPRFEAFEGFSNWLAIQSQNGGNADELPVVAEVAPLVVTSGLLRIQAQPTFLGDVNLDYTVNLTDAVVLLGHLFLEENQVVCVNAADFNQDRALNLTDAVGILNFLFLGGPRQTDGPIFCGSR